jgi:MerR family transcriptional regulator, light-induced transcriptional regulator
MANDVPTFNLKAVVRETGLKPDTIRAWERRYGVPTPRRTLGGHRLYSQRDIDLLKWMNARQHEGMSISRIVDMWKALEGEGKDPLQVTSHSMMVQNVSLGAVGELSKARQEWVQACLNFDAPRADQILGQAFALFSPESVVLEVLLRGLADIGDGWYRGDVAVQQEHFASQLAVRRLQTMIAASPAPTRLERIVVAGPADEQHTLSLLVISLFLRRQGWDVIDLGANVPLDRLEPMLTTIRPQLVIAAAQHLPTAYTLQTMMNNVTRLHIPGGFGGRIFNHQPELRRHIAGHFLGESLTDIPRAAQDILRAPWPLPEVLETSKDYLIALEHYRERLALLEAELMATLDPKSREMVRHSNANGYFADYLSAALALGDIDFLAPDLEWVHGLLATQRLPANALRVYLEAYRGAAQKHLDRRAQMIVTWFDQALEGFDDSPII